ncbi:uncharacterized protein FMAN_02420 [Fusarium mangiferae]|uniref:Uncharacterized protein n=1 Tax=Fusarium mangiferae TaxID=192010 RepID=A0A1L7TRX4_FUSMA|nr:uncharacterized protein FMAN_02420 [Fusarium mangiferae]CVK99582.1 uncharacterized protein FMAN_02420 [Fusarium mangiferae]
MRMFIKCDWMNSPTKNEIMITKDVSQPVISGGPMEELADDIEDIALEIKDTQPDLALRVKVTSERLSYTIDSSETWITGSWMSSVKTLATNTDSTAGELGEATKLGVDGQESNSPIMQEFTDLVKRSGGGRLLAHIEATKQSFRETHHATYPNRPVKEPRYPKAELEK